MISVRLAWLVSGSLGALTGCKSIEGTRGVPPFYEVYDTPSSVGSEKGTETFFRPLGSFERLETGTEAMPQTSRHLRFLSPLLDFRWGRDGRRHWVLPVFLYRSYPQPGGGEDLDWMLFPFLFGGSDPDEGSYFAFFPFGGKLRGLLAHDEIVFALVPLYWRWTTGERHSLHVLWPFFNAVRGGDWSGWRLWPFYGRYRTFTHDGSLESDRGFVLWPFYGRHREQLNVDPTHVFYSLPFYGERINRRVETYAYLWPLFQTHLDKREGRKTYLGYLIPYRITEGQLDIWPLFGSKRASQGTAVAGAVRRTYRQFFLWPVERYEWGADGLGETTRFWLLPLLWHFHYIDGDTLETETEWTLWPLFRYRRVGSRVSFDLASPLWFRREDYDRLYSRLFNVVRYRSGSEVSGWELVYGAIQYRRDEAEGEAVFSLLGGLLEAGTRRGGIAFRLFYVPWW